MATNLLPVSSVMIRASAASGPHLNRRRNSSSSGNWWTSLFGWSSEPDYIGPDSKSDDAVDKTESRSESDLDSRAARSRFTPGGFTEEKARQLRMLTSDTTSYYDVMYHSAIASRLASDFKNRSDR